MTLSDLILEKGQIMLTQTSIEDNYLDNSPFLYGNVERVSDLTDMYAIDDKVLFDAGTATKISLNNEYYYLINEDNIYLTFINVTPP
jgi:hypothetical protein